MAIRSIQLDTVWKKVVLFVTAAVLFPAVWFVAKWTMAGSAAGRVDTAELAVYLTQLAPDDPQTHYVAAAYLEKSFDPKDIARAVHELETAAALAPQNYMLWLELGRARERSGDPEGGEAALRRALSLAPNYSRVQWALGNLLLRQDRIDEAFTEIRKAVTGDKAFAGPAASAAWQFFDGDVARIRSAMGNSLHFNAALSLMLARAKRFDEAMSIWNELPAGDRGTTLNEVRTSLVNEFLGAKKFRYAYLAQNDGASDKVGVIANGGFESAVKPEGAGTFEWQIAPGLQPQIVLSTAQKHGGNNSLMLVFNASNAKDFRQVSQTVAVQPGRTYELELFYRSELKTAAVFKWEVVDTADGRPIAVSEPTQPRADWTRLAVRFKAGEATEAVTIRLIREGCGQVCAVAGNLWFDDFVLRDVQ